MQSRLERYLDQRRVDIGDTGDMGAASAVGERIVSVDIHLKRADGTFPTITHEVLTEARLAAFASFGEKLAAPDITRGIVVMGAPCSGKSSVVAKLSEKHGDVVFFEATLSTHQERLSLMQAARASGKPVHCIYMTADVAVLAARNQQRTGNRQLPADAFVGMLTRLARQPPSIAEGFASVTRLSDYIKFEQTVAKTLVKRPTGFDLSAMAYYSPADFNLNRPHPKNPIPMLDTIFARASDTRVGMMHGAFERCHNGHIAAFVSALDAKDASGRNVIDMLIVAPAREQLGKPWLGPLDYRIELLRRAIAAHPALATRVYVTDAARAPTFPSNRVDAMRFVVDCYDRDVPGQFTLVEGTPLRGSEYTRALGPEQVLGRAGHLVTGRAVEISSSELRAALSSGNLDAIADRVPESTLAAMKSELALRDIPLLRKS